MMLIPMAVELVASVFPIGDNFTMGIEDAIVASDLVQCETVIGCHFNTFEPIKIDVEEAKSKFSRANKELTILEIGEVITL